MRLRYLLIGAFAILILFVGGTVIRWGMSPAHYGAYVHIKCIENTEDGNSCIQRDITSDERRALMHGRALADGGYFEMVGAGRDFRIIDDVIEISTRETMNVDDEVHKKVRSEVGRCGGAFRTISVLPEFPGRWSGVYDVGGGRRGLLTRYDFFAVGGRLGSFEYLLRTSVNGNPASTVLLRQKRGAKRLWMITWESRGVAFELSLDDQGPSNYSLADVMNIASIIDKQCHWERAKYQPLELPFPPPIGQG